MSFLDPLKRWLVRRIDPRLELSLLELRTQDEDELHRELLRQKRAVRQNLRALKELRTASDRELEESPKVIRKKKITATREVKPTSAKKKASTKKAPKEKKERPKSKREKFLAAVDRFRANSRPIEHPKPPFERLTDASKPVAGSAYDRLREFCSTQSMDATGDKIVVRMSDHRKRA